jgi:hypothetical protein
VLAIVLVLDVAVRRVRFSGAEVRASYRAVRKQLGYVDERPIAMPSRIATSRVAVAPKLSTRPSPQAARAEPVSFSPATSRSSQLLAAKRRARR